MKSWRASSYNQAIAWVGARLAEALDHAYSRDVAHGDVKPSNILLSADGNPMLLDFNLARDWSPAGMDLSKVDTGGTLAYMAPERLQGLAGQERTRDDGCSGSWPLKQSSDEQLAAEDRTIMRNSAGLQEPGPHQADIYSLGMVLLEALTGEPPAPAAVSGTMAGATDFDRLRAIAGAIASSRSRGATFTVRDSEHSGRRSINLGLRDPLALPRSGPLEALSAGVGARGRSRSLADGPAVGLRFGAILGPDRTQDSAAPPTNNDFDRGGLFARCRTTDHGLCAAQFAKKP